MMLSPLYDVIFPLIRGDMYLVAGEHGVGEEERHAGGGVLELGTLAHGLLARLVQLAHVTHLRPRLRS